MEVKVVIGSNYGDEGKGLTSANLARAAANRNHKILTVFYNGTMQRCHSIGNAIYHSETTGTIWGSDTYYHSMFVVDPITLWLEQARVYIDPNCRLILPCDVLSNRTAEKARGNKRHGSCGFGLFAAVQRSLYPEYNLLAHELLDPYSLYLKLKKIQEHYPMDWDEVYNTDNFMRAAAYISNNCRIIPFFKLLSKKHYETIIYEGGQGLLLDQSNLDNFPHLTPSSVGLFNIKEDIEKLTSFPELYYVSRTYITRHGAGPMEAECKKEDINPLIIDEVNQPNEWQGNLRFGRINIDSLYKRIQTDAKQFIGKPSINLVFTQLNYTDNKIETTQGKKEIVLPSFCDNLYASNNKTEIYNYSI